jgi:hypothetical protein
VHADVNSILGLLHLVDVGIVAGASEVHVATIVRIEVSKVVQLFVYIDPVKRKTFGRQAYQGQKDQLTRKVSSSSFKGHYLCQKITEN